jgi:hypothetical protein
MKDLSLATGHWWRWTRYQIRGGYIRPARSAQLRVYDPWKLWLATRPLARSSNQRGSNETPYQSLLALLRELEYRPPGNAPLDFKPGEVDLMPVPLTADSETKLLGWCADYGLLGVLPHRAVQVTLAPRTRVQLQYTKIGAGWTVTARPTRRRSVLTPCAVLQPLRGAGPVVEPLDRTWSRFFPQVPPDQRETFGYPEPLTKDFWAKYAEPVAEFLSGMRALGELHQAIQLFQARQPSLRRIGNLQAFLAGGPDLIPQGLIAGVGLALEWDRSRHVELKWVASSLLASLALMMLQDLAHGRALQCPRCGRAFITGAYQGRYCSVRCRWVTQKREYRKKPR